MCRGCAWTFASGCQAANHPQEEGSQATYSTTLLNGLVRVSEALEAGHLLQVAQDRKALGMRELRPSQVRS